jgi:hypothetical protein
MDPNQHNHEESAVGRPDDPAVIAAAAGKTTPERSSKEQQQHQPSRQHNRGPPSDQDVDHFIGDFLVGAAAIRAFLVKLGIPEKTADPYYLKRSGRGWPIGNTGGSGGNLIASKRKLIRHVERLTTPASAA